MCDSKHAPPPPNHHGNSYIISLHTMVLYNMVVWFSIADGLKEYVILHKCIGMRERGEGGQRAYPPPPNHHGNSYIINLHAMVCIWSYGFLLQMIGVHYTA